MAEPHPHLDIELLSAYIDGEVTEEERARVQEHVERCTGCRAELESLQRTVNLMNGIPNAPLPQTFYISAAMAEPDSGRSGGGWSLGWQQLAATLATVAAVLACVILVASPLSFIGAPSDYEMASAPAQSEEEQSAGQHGPEDDEMEIAVGESADEAAGSESAEEGGVAASEAPAEEEEADIPTMALEEPPPQEGAAVPDTTTRATPSSGKDSALAYPAPQQEMPGGYPQGYPYTYPSEESAEQQMVAERSALRRALPLLLASLVLLLTAVAVWRYQQKNG